MRGKHSPVPSVSANAHRETGKSSREFLPYPVELADIERREALPRTKVLILMFRRFADPVAGVWETSIKEIAGLLHCGRSTVQKAIRRLERQGFIHVRHRRGRTVKVLLYFGGFPRPEHKKLGLAPLYWDSDVTPPEAAEASPSGARGPLENTRTWSVSGSAKEKTIPRGSSPGTLMPETNTYRTHIRRSELFNPRTTGTPVSASSRSDAMSPWTPVDQFQAKNHEEAVVQQLAGQLGERSINGFLALFLTYGLDRLQRACGLARDKMEDDRHPLRQKPGAYVRWLLQHGKC